MIKSILLAVLALIQPVLTVETPKMNIAQADVIEQAEEPVEVPEAEIIEPTVEVVEPTVEPVMEVQQEELPTPADEFEYHDHILLGTYTVTWYSAEECGNSIGAAEAGLTAGYSVAMPDYSLLGATVLIEGYGYYHVDDISPDGIVDIFVWSNSDIPAHGMDTANVYIVS